MTDLYWKGSIPAENNPDLLNNKPVTEYNQKQLLNQNKKSDDEA